MLSSPFATQTSMTMPEMVGVHAQLNTLLDRTYSMMDQMSGHANSICGAVPSEVKAGNPLDPQSILEKLAILTVQIDEIQRQSNRIAEVL